MTTTQPRRRFAFATPSSAHCAGSGTIRVMPRGVDAFYNRAYSRKAMSTIELPPVASPQWTQEQAIAFESACECISDLMAIYTARIEDAKRKNKADAHELAALRAERSRLARERAELHVPDQAEIARIRAQYGEIIRAWRADHHAIAA